MKFNNTKPDKDLSELDESFVYMRLEDEISIIEPSNHNIEVIASNPPLDGPQREVREPTDRNIRKKYPKS